MTNLTDSTQVNQMLLLRRSRGESPWLWTGVVGGSVAVHLLLGAIVIPLAHRLSAAAPAATGAQVPIEFVELSTSPAKSAAVPKAGAPKPAAPKAAPIAQPAEITAPPGSIGLTAAPPEPVAKAEPEPSTAAPDRAIPNDTITSSAADTLPYFSNSAPVAPPQPEVSPSIEPTSLPSLAPSPLESPPESPPAAATSPSASPILPDPAPTVAASPLPNPIPSITPSPLPTVVPSPAPSPSAPAIATIPIDQAVPDVSGRLETGSSPTAGLPTIATNSTPTPVNLVANLRAAPLPAGAAAAATAESSPEPIAQPSDAVNGTSSRTFVSDPTTSACVLQPGAVPFLGQTVRLRIATNAQGQVTETQVQRSSQNPAYDDLAVCLVKSWGFNPATKQGQPIDSALQIEITVNRS